MTQKLFLPNLFLTDTLFRDAVMAGWLLFKEESKKMPVVGGVLNVLGPILISLAISMVFAYRGHGFDLCRFHFVFIAIFSFLLLMDHFFSALSLAWKQRQLILNSNFTMAQITVIGLVKPFVQVIPMLLLLLIVFDSAVEHLSYMTIFFIWLSGLQSMARVAGSIGRWLGKFGSILGRAFFILSPIIWIPSNTFQEQLVMYNPLVWLLDSFGISWLCEASFSPFVWLSIGIPIMILFLLSGIKTRHWLCPRLR